MSQSKKNDTKLYVRDDNVWQIIIASLIGKNSLKLRVQSSGAYSRDLLFILVSDYLIQMMEMDRKLQEKFRPSEAKEIVVQKMFKRYGEELVMLWSKEVKLEIKNILYEVQEHTNRWKRDDIDTPIQLITTLGLARFKSEIIENIIEPYLFLRSINLYKKRCLPTFGVRGTTTESMEKEATESSTVIPSEVTTYAMPVSSLLDQYTAIFMTYLREAYNGRIPEHHTLCKSKLMPQLDVRIVRLCWVKTLETKPLREEHIASTWSAVKNRIDARINYYYKKKDAV